MASTMIQAYDFKEGGICYTITSADNKTVAVVGYESNAEDGNTDYIGVDNNTGTADAKAFGVWLNRTTDSYNVIIPNTITYKEKEYSVTSIEKKAFYKKYMLTEIIIPASVTNIEPLAFAYCTGLTKITNYAVIPQRVAQDTFYGINKVAERYCIELSVPYTSLQAYKTVEVWREFYNIQAVSILGDVNHDGVVTIADADIITNYYLGVFKMPLDIEIADVNGDGKITIADANAIVNIFLTK